ncbi:hypothetical protein OSB04_016133 [Centaurea solstitialis]|uniref:NB-ARC domain-containing protein n=1 Tax=Centaurea solstitialis TaxID=347529 RepID=A0AA38T0F6_9ASTR|nr:hypothetical protein OSB04_016133 [Centaurea solstitialis]
MAYADLRIFMENLKLIIHDNHHPLINNNPLILCEWPHFQLLYQELDSIIQTLFSVHEDHHRHQHHELEKVRNLKKRFKDAAQEAQDTIDLFLFALHFKNRGVSHISDELKNIWCEFLDGRVFTFRASIDYDIRRCTISDIYKESLELLLSALHFRKTSLDLKKILESIKSIRVELKPINIGNVKIDSSSRIDHVKTKSVAAAAGTSYTRNPIEIKKSSKEFVVGLDHDAGIVRDKLTEDTKQLCVVSIVGMGGLGKTTLATKLFNDPFIKYHFHIRAWATVSQTYSKRDMLIQILASIGVQEDLDQASDSELRGKLHQNLMGRRYLIVIDDIWSIEAWDELKLLFPHDNTASRILLTSRLNEVALHVKPHGFVHSLPCLTEEESWELLKLKVFHGDECPKSLIKPVRQIARKCQGLPLSVVVMAGVLATTRGFPEDHCFNVKRLTWLWVAEGFIEEARNQSLEVTAKDYLMDLIDRNLVTVAERTFSGKVKACKLHDLVRELCMQQAKKKNSSLKLTCRHCLLNFLRLWPQIRIVVYLQIIYTLRILLVLPPHGVRSTNVHAWSVLCRAGIIDSLKPISLTVIEKSMNLQSISGVRSEDGVDNIGRYFPTIKKLGYVLESNEKCHFEDLPYLENMKLSLKFNEKTFPRVERQESLLNRIWFPASLKKLTLVRCGLPWSDMSVIQALPNLEVLKLIDYAFLGSQWDACEHQFHQLKFLKLERLNIRRWEVYSASFPCLERLALLRCYDLEGVPLEIGDILTLELIEIDWIPSTAMESVKRILKEQRDDGNTLLKIFVEGMELSEHEDSESE